MAWLFFGLSGRISRLVFFLASLFLVVVESLVLYQVVQSEGTAGADLWSTLLVASWAGTLWPQVALAGKRLHDFGQPALFAILVLVPVVSLVVFVGLCVWPGDGGPNRFGGETDAPDR